jgi:hypothetical protein
MLMNVRSADKRPPQHESNKDLYDDYEPEAISPRPALSASAGVPASVQWSVSMVSSPPGSLPSSPRGHHHQHDACGSRPASPEHHHQQQHQRQRQRELQRHLVYYFTAVPEKGRPIWAVFYDRADHPLDAFALRLTPDDSHHADDDAEQVDRPGVASHMTLRADAEISWRASNNEGTSYDVGLIQYKIAFDCPNDTYQRTIFRAQLTNSVTGLAIDLGLLSIVSTTCQRSTAFMERFERRCPTDNHRRLVANFKRHPRKKRHFINGKGRSQGAKQASRRGHRFIMEEYVWAVEL